MMNVGLETVASSRPRPAATPFASTVFPAPSSPHSASTSPGFARRARRSPIRSVCSEEWLTRSMVSTLRGGAGGCFALELSALKNESDGKPEERAEETRPDEQPPIARDHAERIDERAAAAAQRREQREDAEEADEVPATADPLLARLELRTPLLVLADRALLLGYWSRHWRRVAMAHLVGRRTRARSPRGSRRR